MPLSDQHTIALETKLARARLLYVNAQTASDRDAVLACRESLDRAPRGRTKMHERRLALAEMHLQQHRQTAGEIFDAVVSGEIEP